MFMSYLIAICFHSNIVSTTELLLSFNGGGGVKAHICIDFNTKTGIQTRKVYIGKFIRDGIQKLAGVINTEIKLPAGH